jgi:hypothetical protein
MFLKMRQNGGENSPNLVALIRSSFWKSVGQGCQMVSFQTKNLNLGKFWRVLDEKMLIYFRAIWNIL